MVKDDKFDFFGLSGYTVDELKEQGKIPIQKRSVSTDDAIELFHDHHMYDKERLFRYRRVSRVNMYSIDGFEDYYYGYMVPDTGYLKYFDLKRYQYGFVLLLPTMGKPKELPEFVPQDKLLVGDKAGTAGG